MREREIVIHNKAGIHCRPSGVILRTIQNEFPLHAVSVRRSDGEECDVDSILALISLCLMCGDRATLRIEGPDEDRAIQRIGDLFEYEFDFPPRT